VALFIELL